MTAARKLSIRFRVGKRFRCTMSADLDAGPQSISCEWFPDLPKRLKARDVDDYRRGRDEFFAQLGDALGQKIMVVEPGPSSTRVTVPSAAECSGSA